MPECPTHSDVSLELTSRGWYCPYCDCVVLRGDSAALPGIDLERLPAFLALPLAAWAAENDPRERIWRIVEAVELLVRYLVAIGVADWVRRGGFPPELRARLAGRMERPSFGAWIGVTRGLLGGDIAGAPGATPPSAVFSRAQHACQALAALAGRNDDSHEERLLPLRNLIAHAGVSCEEARRQLRDCGHEQRALELFRSEQAWLGEHLVLYVSRPGRYFQLRGPRPEPSAAGPFGDEIGERLDASAGSVVLLSPDGELLDLGPLCAFGVPETGQEGDYARRGLAQVPEVFIRVKAAALLYRAIGGEPPVAERYDTLERFRTLFGTTCAEPSTDRAEPIDSWAELQADDAGRVGREAELSHVVRTLAEAHSGVFWLPGAAGIGKSVLVAAVACHNKLRGDPSKMLVVPHRFRLGDARCTRTAFLRQAISSLQRWWPIARGLAGETSCDLRTEGDEALELRLGELLSRVAALPPRSRHRLARAPRVLFVLDGLDEIANSDEGMAELPLRHLRENTIWLLSGRPKAGLNEQMSAATQLFPSEKGGPGGLPPMSDADIRAMLLEGAEGERLALLARDREEPDRVTNDAVEAVARRAAGLPVYVKLVLDDLLTGKVRVDRLDELPASLEAYYEELLRRCGIDDLQQVLTPLLATLALAEEPLDGEALAALLAKRGLLEAGPEGLTLVRKALKAAGAMLRLAPLAEGGVGLTLYHESFRKHVCTSERTRQAVLTAARAMAVAVGAWDEAGLEPARAHLFRRGVGMLCAEGEPATAARLLTSLDYLRCRLRLLGHDGLRGLFADFASLSQPGCRAKGDAPSEKQLPDEVRARVGQYRRFLLQHGPYLACRPDAVIAQALFDADLPEVRRDAEAIAATAGLHLKLAGSARQRPGSTGSAEPGAPSALLWHDPTSTPAAIALSATGRTLITGDADGALRALDADTGLVERSYLTFGEAIWSLAVTPDGKRVAVAHAGGAVGLWDVEAGTYRPFTGLWRVRVVSLREASDNLTAYFVGFSDGTFAMRYRGLPWCRTRTDEEVAADPIDRLAQQRVSHHIELLPSGCIVLGGAGGRTIFDPAGEPQSKATAVLDLEPGQTAISGHLDGAIREWSIETGEELSLLREGAAIVYLALTPDRQTLLAATADGLIGEWDLARRRRAPLLERQGDRQRSAIVEDGCRWGASWHDGDHTVFAMWTKAEDGHVRCRSASTRDPSDERDAAGGIAAVCNSFVVGTAEGARVAISDDGSQLVAAGGNDFQGCRVATWSVEAPEDPELLVGCQHKPTALARGPDGLVSVGTKGGEVCVWEAMTGRVAAREDLEGRVMALGFSDRRTLLLLHGAYLECARTAKLLLGDGASVTSGTTLSWRATGYRAAVTRRGTLVVLGSYDYEVGLAEIDPDLRCLRSNRCDMGLGAQSVSAMAPAPDAGHAVLVCPRSGIYAVDEEIFTGPAGPASQAVAAAPPYRELRLAREELVVGREDQALERGRERLAVWDATSCRMLHLTELDGSLADWTVAEGGSAIHVLPADDGPAHRVRLSREEGVYTPLWGPRSNLLLGLQSALLLGLWVIALAGYVPVVLRHQELLRSQQLWMEVFSDPAVWCALVCSVFLCLSYWFRSNTRRLVNRTILGMRIRRIRAPARIGRRAKGKKGLALSRNGRWAVVAGDGQATGCVTKVLDLSSRSAGRRRDAMLVSPAGLHYARIDSEGRWLVVLGKYGDLDTVFLDRPWPHRSCRQDTPRGTGGWVVFELTEAGLLVFRTVDGGLELRLADHRLCEASRHFELRRGDGACPWKRAGMCPLAGGESGPLVSDPHGPCTLSLRAPSEPAVDRPPESGDTKSVAVRPSLKFGHLVFSRGQEMVATANRETISVWTLPEGRLVAHLEGHTAAVNDVAFSFDGGRLASISEDRTLRLWDLQEACELTSLQLPSRPACCAVTRKGRIMVSLVEGQVLFFGLDGADPARQVG